MIIDGATARSISSRTGDVCGGGEGPNTRKMQIIGQDERQKSVVGHINVNIKIKVSNIKLRGHPWSLEPGTLEGTD